jgi:sigma-B regulation protein RsbU (phosphoserine phosphatase)
MEEPSAAGMLEAVNLSLSDRPIAGQYVSIIYGIWDDNQRVLQVANSGLPRPLHFRNQTVEEIQVTGLPIGLFGQATYEHLDVRAKAGDVFVLFSDGILDATSAKGEMFGRGRLEKLVADNAHRPAEELVDTLFNAVSEHAEGVDAFDDQTIVVLKVKGPSSKK